MNSWSILVVLLTIGTLTTAFESCSTNNALRLVWGNGNWEGNIQICIGGVWGWVCDNGFTGPDAQVVCKQLGFSTTGALYRTWSYYGWGNRSTPIHLDHLNCAGTETSLASCSHTYAVGFTNCGYNEIAGVVCPKGGTCTNGSIRKIRNSNGTPYRGGGRIEVCANSQWGTVCDDYWSSTDARVACFQLGYTKNRAYSVCCANSFGQGYGPIHLDNVGCSGSETTLLSCSANAIGSHNCGHNEDAGAWCYGQLSSSCTNGDVKLWRPENGAGPEYFGLALYCKNNAWTAVCDDSFTCHTARLFCQKLGYPGAINVRSEGYWGYYNNIDHYAWSCSSSHSHLSQCSYYYHSNCVSFHDQFGIICYPGVQGTECTDGSVRLTNGTSSTNGRAEYCFEGSWAPLCGMSANTASAICQSLGFSNFAIVYNDERFGTNELRTGLNYINCPSGATNVTTDCSPVRKTSGSCYIRQGKCSREYGLQCYQSGSCVDGSTRLRNGTIQQEGRMEICLNGVWGTVCSAGWNAIDAYVVCKQLGYTGSGPITYYNAKFGTGSLPPLFGNVLCHGWEDSIDECSKTVYPALSCSQTSTLGVVCKEGCNNGDVRLLGGGFENEGTVQVCYNNLWGLVSDANWDDNDARVVCNQLGYTGGNALAVLGSQYGKPNMTIHLRDVSCTGTEMKIDACTKTQLSVSSGSLQLVTTDAAGVDCIYDMPTDPPCVPRPASFDNAGTECPTNGAVRLMNGDQPATGAGRLEYCYNGYWTSVCKLTPFVASLACRDLGYTDYTWATIVETGEFGTLRNFSLIDSIVCSGSENSLTNAGCVATTNTTCTPYCSANLGLRCFNKVAPAACSPEGAIRLADGIIESEGRVEVCTNGVWGAVCDKGWDKTDAHVVCQQLGHPELEPIVFNNSEFGSGLYPIVYSNTDCGGYESRLADCNKLMTPWFNCSRQNTAGVLCGYDCTDGAVRLVGGNSDNEGTVEICFNNLWGLVSANGWTSTEASLLCQQLGYEKQGSVAATFDKPNLVIHYSDFECNGDESTITDCTYTTHSLQEGKDMLQQATNVAGVTCNLCSVTLPPLGNSECADGNLRLTGGGKAGEGKLEYCYRGTWSGFCSLGANESVVACRQLGYSQTDVAVVFTDGRFDNSSIISPFQQFSCMAATATTLSDCSLLDRCPSSCDVSMGLRCYEETSCSEGEVRLVDGDFDTEGRLEVCHNNIWGSVCASNFEATDAHVVCKQLQLGTSEPVVYTNSYFGAGDVPIVLSDVQCRGYERSIVNCAAKDFGSFSCSRDTTVGIVCQSRCTNGAVQLISNNSTFEGTVQVCSDNTWGLIADSGWNMPDAQVVCMQLGYTRGGQPVLGSAYGKPNKTILFTNVDCTGTEPSIVACNAEDLSSDEGRDIFPRTNVAGVRCIENSTEPTVDALASAVSSSGALAGLIVALVLLVLTVVVTLGMIAYIFVKGREVNKGRVLHEPRVTMSGLGAENPMSGLDQDDYAYDKVDLDKYLDD